MRDMANMTLRLVLFALVAAVLLAVTHLVTEGPIAAQEKTASDAARIAVLPGAEFGEEPLAISEEDAKTYPLVDRVYEGTIDGALAGYVLTASPQGYGGEIPITLGIGVDGSIQGITVGSLSETSGIGTKVAEEPFLSQYTALAADPDVIESDVDTIGGATVSSTAFKQATEQMTGYARDVLGIVPQAGQAPLSADDLARQEQLPGAKAFDLIDPFTLLGDYDTLREVYRAVDGNETVGYIFELAPQGFVGEIKLRLAVSSEGKIAALTVLENPESEEYGQRISREPEFIDSFIGKDAVAEQIEGIDTLSGATGTSNAVKGSVAQAVQFFNTYLANETAQATDTESGATGEAEATATPQPDAESGATGEAEATATPAPDAESGATGESAEVTAAPTATPATDAESGATEEAEGGTAQ